MSKKIKPIDIWAELAKPFESDEIEWRCGPTNKDKSKCLALPYITNRAIQNRLDSVVGQGNWQTTFRSHGEGTICALSVRVDGEWITKEDGASNTHIEPVKGGISDSMKRAAVQFGIGRYLYEAESNWVAAKPVGNTAVITGTPKLTFKKSTQSVEKVEQLPKEDTSEPAEARAVQVAIKKLMAAETLDELSSIFMSLGTLKADPEVLAIKDQLKQEFLSV